MSQKKSYISENAMRIFNKLVPGTKEYEFIPIHETYSSIIQIMKDIWKGELGDHEKANPEHEIPAFTRKFWIQTLAERSRTRYIENRMLPQVEKLCKEAQCLKQNPECVHDCPTDNPIVCEVLKIKKESKL